MNAVRPRLVLLAVLAVSTGCSDEKSDCSEVDGLWEMDFRASDWNAANCPTLPGLSLSAPVAQAPECHLGCTCSFGKFSMHSEHDDSDYCGAPFQESCASDSSTMNCDIELETNTNASGFCRMQFATAPDPCDYFIDLAKD